MSAAQIAFDLGGPVSNIFIGFALGIIVGTKLNDGDSEECTPCSSEDGGLETGALLSPDLLTSGLESSNSPSTGLKNADLSPAAVKKAVTKPANTDGPQLNVISSMVNGCPRCAEGWDYFQGSCYHIVIETETEPFWDGQADCARLGAKLAQLETKEEDDFIIQEIKKRNLEKKKLWLGLNKLEQHNGHPKPEPFVWGIVAPQGTLDLHKNWAGPDKNQPPGKHYCGAIYNGQWIDLDCAARIHYICEKECSELKD